MNRTQMVIKAIDDAAVKNRDDRIELLLELIAENLAVVCDILGKNNEKM